MCLKLTQQELRDVYQISASCNQSVEALCQRLEKLTWGDGLLEFRMQAGVGLLPWMEQLLQLSDRINQRLQDSGVPFGPSLEDYQATIEADPKCSD